MSAVVAVAALFLADHYGAPVMLFALLLGMAVNFLSEDARCKAGIEFVARQVLRWGVALLGLKITIAQVQALGWQSVFMVVLAVALTIGLGLLMARWMGFSAFFGLLSGGAVGICGASAALAIAAAFPNHPQKDRATLFVVISVSTLSTVAMVLYPMLTHWLGFNPEQSGFFLGGTIHDVAQVVGAGYSMSQQTGDAATVIKLMRVAMLVPVIMVAAWMTRIAHAQQARDGDGEAVDTTASRPPLLPWFAVVFVLLVLLNSFLPMPDWVSSTGHALSRAFLVAAMAAIGIKTHLKDILSVGWKPVALMLLETLILAVLVYGFLLGLAH
ncbi:putative sulfate exporter family transporter [Limnohabitans sp. TS-CS-82]|uniref:YeiH family protein n=1 Tax=Limnohabitans sp. TS-CS-82 TaxID=2094193 RepID=UPI000CF2FB0F|nr:putative sulfate exporter family transporter [Limnohabitans sp. TS-CS-82]PQA82564.1 putative sulfate exporter family transporter [Limnohabitans sp. TS-CS-82]